ncbi:MAG TPA: hypothetical protein DCZ80_01155, partial [Legionellales bacterium]|nr:hypothetical protein [Legionellales bacterium]
MNNKDESSLYQRTKQIFKKLIKDSIINYIGTYPKKHYSFKYIRRYIQSGKAPKEVLKTINEDLQKNEFESIINLLAELDWPHAEQYFKDNPQEMYCGRKQGSIFSYIKFENEIYRRDVFIGAGAFGKVKTAKSKAGEEIIIKRQTLRQDDN